MTSGASPEALFAELRKLAAKEQKKPARWKRVAKTGIAAGAGSLAGYGTGVLLDRAAQKVMGKRYAKWPTSTKLKVILPLLGLSVVGWHASQAYANDARQREYDRE